jgi:sugar phosphate isomerase/epimerase
MRIRYVVSTMVFWWRENHLSLEQECQFLKSLGFGVELWPTIKDQPECRYDRRNWPRLAAATEGMLVSLRSRTDNPNLEQWDEQIACAKLLGANIVTDLRSLGIPEGADGNGTDFAAQVIEIADDNNVKLCLETGPLQLVKHIGEKFDSLWYCLDTGYANLDPMLTFRQYVDELAPRVAHLHLTDNYGQDDDHEPPGLKGGIVRENWDYLLNVMQKHNNDVIGSFEMLPCMPAVMIRRACEFMFGSLHWPNPPHKQPGFADAVYKPI